MQKDVLPVRYLVSLIALVLVCCGPVHADLIILQANTFGADCGKPARIASLNGGWAATYPREGKVVLFGADGSQTGQITGLGTPLGIAFSAPDTLLIGEQNPPRVSVWQTNGTRLRSFGETVLAKPTDIVMDPSGTKIYVLDATNHTVRTFDPLGARFADIGNSTRLLHPNGLTLDAASGTLMVGEMITGVIHAYGTTGVWLRDIGASGKGQGQFMRVGGMACSDLGVLAAADPFLSRAQAIGLDGGFLAEEGTYGDGDEELRTPLDVTVGPGQKLAVADFANGRIVEYWLCYNSAADLLAQNNGAFVTLVGPIVTAGTTEFGASIYVEQDDRSGGIRVDNVTGTIERGAMMQISGTIATDNGERHINATSVSSIFGWVVPAPFGISAAALGGVSRFPAVPALAGGIGAYDVGLLVRVWGRVTEVSGDDFFISSGAAQNVWVHAPGITKPAAGAYVGVTGICSTAVDDGGRLRARVLPRDAADITDLQGGN